MAMLSDKVPNRGHVIPPQIPPPRDLPKVYAWVGWFLGIALVFVIRNCFRLPVLIGPTLLVFFIGKRSVDVGLLDVLIGGIGGRAIGAYLGTKVQEKNDATKFRERDPQAPKKPD
jgi:hypothetical protein